jgi:site-specific DNA-methyltransferase (adenine-specific)
MTSFNLMHGDCLEMMKQIPDGSVDMVLTDPPYGTTSCKWDSVIPFEPMWIELKRVLRKNGTAVFTSSQPFTSALVMSNPNWFRHEWIWQKNRGSNFANTVREPMKEHESVLVFSDGKWTYNKQMQPREGSGADRAKYLCTFDTGSENYRKFDAREGNTLTELRVPSSVQKFNTASGSEKTKHSTQKPVALMEYLIRTYTNENDTVLDFTMGSGTTGVAAGNLDRSFVGIELDPDYFQISQQRIEEAYNRPSLETFFT